MPEKRFALVGLDILPDVFLRVLKAKGLLASGEAKNVSIATQMAQVSRSAFYKYKDSVFHADTDRETETLAATLLDEPGALQSLLAAISAAGGNVLTINQSAPENGTALVAVVVRTNAMGMSVAELCTRLQVERAVVAVRCK